MRSSKWPFESTVNHAGLVPQAYRPPQMTRVHGEGRAMGGKPIRQTVHGTILSLGGEFYFRHGPGFYDGPYGPEVHTDWFGPYPSEEEAEAAFKAYVSHVVERILRAAMEV